LNDVKKQHTSCRSLVIGGTADEVVVDVQGLASLCSMLQEQCLSAQNQLVQALQTTFVKLRASAISHMLFNVHNEFEQQLSGLRQYLRMLLSLKSMNRINNSSC
jgi:hypothetical protein